MEAALRCRSCVRTGGPQIQQANLAGTLEKELGSRLIGPRRPGQELPASLRLMSSDRRTPLSAVLVTGNQFSLPVLAVRTALDAIESLGPNATSDDIFRASRRFSAATGFLARELNQADQAARLSQGIAVPPVNDAQVVREEVAKLDASATDSQTPPAESPASENVS
jgi:hypothetical protein